MCPACDLSDQGYQSSKILEGEEGIFLLEGIFGRKEGNSFQIPSKYLEGLGRIFFGVLCPSLSIL